MTVDVPPRAVALLVEDDEAVMEAVCSLLDEDYDVDCVSSLLEARGVLRRKQVAVIVLDLMLRGESGAELVEELAAQPEAPAVVLLSASPQAAHVADQFGVAFLRKPFDIEDLLRTLDVSRREHRRPTKRMVDG